jgi:tetratricopeptide (TPR) repeat protein
MTRKTELAIGPRLVAATISLLCLLAAPQLLPARQDQGAAPPVPPAPATQPDERATALDLFKKAEYLQALPLFEDLVARNPNDAVLHEGLGNCLMQKAATLPKGDDRRQLWIRARRELLEAQRLGDDTQIVRVLLTMLPEDGSEPSFSDRRDVDAAMQEGEAAFARGDLDAAESAYRRALLLDPKQYYAALFIGDVNFRRKDLAAAGNGYSMAIAINPDLETAYRYWGDALMQGGETDKALEKYLDGIVADPYEAPSWSGLVNYARLMKLKLGMPRIQSPNTVTQNGDATNITLDANALGKTDGTDSWIVYDATRALWKKEEFAKQFPNATAYRHSLAEETDALSRLADVVSERLKEGKIKGLDPNLSVLLKLKEDGLIESYVLLSAPDDGIAQDYRAYRDAHGDLLRLYITRYVVQKSQ